MIERLVPGKPCADYVDTTNPSEADHRICAKDERTEGIPCLMFDYDVLLYDAVTNGDGSESDGMSGFYVRCDYDNGCGYVTTTGVASFVVDRSLAAGDLAQIEAVSPLVIDWGLSQLQAFYAESICFDMAEADVLKGLHEAINDEAGGMFTGAAVDTITALNLPAEPTADDLRAENARLRQRVSTLESVLRNIGSTCDDYLMV